MPSSLNAVLLTQNFYVQGKANSIVSSTIDPIDPPSGCGFFKTHQISIQDLSKKIQQARCYYLHIEIPDVQDQENISDIENYLLELLNKKAKNDQGFFAKLLLQYFPYVYQLFYGYTVNTKIDQRTISSLKPIVAADYNKFSEGMKKLDETQKEILKLILKNDCSSYQDAKLFENISTIHEVLSQCIVLQFHTGQYTQTSYFAQNEFFKLYQPKVPHKKPNIIYLEEVRQYCKNDCSSDDNQEYKKYITALLTELQKSNDDERITIQHYLIRLAYKKCSHPTFKEIWHDIQQQFALKEPFTK